MAFWVPIAAGYGIYKGLKWLFSTSEGAQTGGVVASIWRNNVPMLEDEVTVEVVGQPGASKQELYYLALAAANGVVRRFQPLLIVNTLIFPPTAAMIMIEYDAADSWVRCTIRYRVGTSTANVQRDSSGQKPSNDFFSNTAIYRGPPCAVVGGDFDFINTAALASATPLAGIPIDGEGRQPILPWEGRVILTSCPKVQDPNAPFPMPKINQSPAPTQPLLTPFGVELNPIPSPNPKPPGDNRSRGGVVSPVTGDTSGSGGTGSMVDKDSNRTDSCCPKQLDLVELVFSALSDPGSQAKEMWEPPTRGPGGS